MPLWKRRNEDEETECAGGHLPLAGLWWLSAPFASGKKPLSHVFLMLLLDQSWLTVNTEPFPCP